MQGIGAEEFDPFQRPEIAAVQAMISDLYLVLPDVAPGQQFSTPCFRANRQNFLPCIFTAVAHSSASGPRAKSRLCARQTLDIAHRNKLVTEVG